MKRLYGLWLVLALLGCEQSAGEKLVYQVDLGPPTDDQPAVEAAEMEKLAERAVDVLDRRINADKRRARIRSLGQGKIEVAVYGDDPRMVARVARMVEATGTLEFRILANDRDHKDLIEKAKSESADRLHETDAQGKPSLGEDGRPVLLAWWVPVAEGDEATFREYDGIAMRTKARKDEGRTEVLVVNDDYNLTGKYLDHAATSIDRSGRPNVLLTFSRRGGWKFGGLTGNNPPDEASGFARRLAIILNGHLHGAPAIQAVIFQSAEITGDFTVEEVQDLTDVLNGGSLPVRLKKVEASRPKAKP
ncbi:MAG: SecDF P1 head subdomain-containing protein [Planctomycetota bacterium]|jgi:preprotein translocase subunit SecD